MSRLERILRNLYELNSHPDQGAAFYNCMKVALLSMNLQTISIGTFQIMTNLKVW